MRDWGISSFKSIKVYNKSLINSRLTSFEYENPDVFYRKDQENAIVDQILNILNQMITLKNNNETNFSFLQTQIDYYMLMITNNMSITGLYEEIKQAIKQADFNEKHEQFSVLNEKIEHLRTENNRINQNKTTNMSMLTKDITNKTNFNLSNVKKSFINRFNSLEKNQQSEFCSMYDVSHQEVQLLRNATRIEWINFIKKISQNTSNIEQKVSIDNGQQIYFDEKLNRKTQNNNEINNTEKYLNIMNFLDNQHLEEWEVVKNEYLSLERSDLNFEADFSKIYNFSKNDNSQKNTEAINEVRLSVKNIRENLVNKINLELLNNQQLINLDMLKETLNSTEMAIISNDIITKIEKNRTFSSVSNNLTAQEEISSDNFNLHSENVMINTLISSDDKSLVKAQENQNNPEIFSNVVNEVSVLEKDNLINNEYFEEIYSLAEKIVENKEYFTEKAVNFEFTELNSQEFTTNDTLLFAEKILKTKEIFQNDKSIFSEKYSIAELLQATDIYNLIDKNHYNFENYGINSEKNIEISDILQRKIDFSNVLTTNHTIESLDIKTEKNYNQEIENFVNSVYSGATFRIQNDAVKVVDLDIINSLNFIDGNEIQAIENLKTSFIFNLLKNNPNFTEKILNIAINRLEKQEKFTDFIENLSKDDKFEIANEQEVENIEILTSILLEFSENEWNIFENTVTFTGKSNNYDVNTKNTSLLYIDSIKNIRNSNKTLIEKSKLMSDEIMKEISGYYEMFRIVLQDENSFNFLSVNKEENKKIINIIENMKLYDLSENDSDDTVIEAKNSVLSIVDSKSLKEISVFVEKFIKNIILSNDQKTYQFKENLIKTISNNEVFYENTKLNYTGNNIAETEKMSVFEKIVDSLRYATETTNEESVKNETNQEFYNLLQENSWITANLIENVLQNEENNEIYTNIFTKNEISSLSENIGIIKANFVTYEEELRKLTSENYIDYAVSNIVEGVSNYNLSENIADMNEFFNTYQENIQNINENYTEIVNFIEDFNEMLSFFNDSEWSEFKENTITILENKDFFASESNLTYNENFTRSINIENVHNMLAVLKRSSESGNDEFEESEKRREFMLFTSENVFSARQIIENIVQISGKEGILTQYFADNEISIFSQNLDKFKDEASNLYEITTKDTFTKLTLNEQNNLFLREIGQNNLLNITENSFEEKVFNSDIERYEDISNFINNFCEVISFLDDSKWDFFKQNILENYENIDFSQFLETNLDDASNSLFKQNNAIRNILTLLNSENNTYTESFKKQELIDFMQKNFNFANEIINNQLLFNGKSDIFNKYFENDEILAFNENLDYVKNLYENEYLQNNVNFNHIAHSTNKFNNQEDLRNFSDFSEIIKLFSGSKAEIFEDILKNYSFNDFFDKKEIEQLILPAIEILNFNYNSMSSSFKNLLSTDFSTSNSSIFSEVLEDFEIQNFYNVDRNLTNFTRVTNKIENNKQGVNTEEFLLHLTEENNNNLQYVFANTVIAPKKETDFAPLVNTISNVVYEKVVAETNLKNNISNINFTTNEASPKNVDVEILTEKMNNHEKELQKLQNEYKNILKVTDISRINRKLEKKLQSNIKMQNIKNGL